MKPETPDVPGAKRALLDKYLRGELPATTLNTITQLKPPSAAPASSTNSRAPLIAVQPGGSKRPFFYLHVHWQGGAFYCFTLARDLGSDQPFYVLDPYRFDDLAAPPTIEAMAADYIESLRTVQPEGPFLLGAFCGASLVAYEMAQQLRVQGQVVDLLVFIDPMAGPIQSIRLIGRFIRRIANLLHLSPGTQLDRFLLLRHMSRVLRRSHDEYTEHADRVMQRWREEHPRRFSLLPAAGALRLDWMAMFIWAVSGYVPRPYSGKVTYLFARDNHDSRRLWWGKVNETESVGIHTIPGTHVTCRTEHIHDLARHLGMCLDEAQGRTQP